MYNSSSASFAALTSCFWTAFCFLNTTRCWFVATSTMAHYWLSSRYSSKWVWQRIENPYSRRVIVSYCCQWMVAATGAARTHTHHTDESINESIHPSIVRISRTHAALCSAKSSSTRPHRMGAHGRVLSTSKRDAIISYMQSNLKRYSEDSGQGHTQHDTLAGTSIN